MQITAFAIAANLVLASATLPAAPDASPAPAGIGEETFRIVDRVAPDEIEEVTTVIVDGRTVRSFRLDEDTPAISIPVSVTPAETHEFGLCGHILVRAPDGTTVQRSFDIMELLHDVVDREFEAVASDGYTHFYLVDTTPGRPPARIEPIPGRACNPAVSMR
jgi:hypothetical protein